MKKILKNFGKNLKKYRKECNYTQEQFVELANMSVTHLSLLESGRYNTTLTNVEKFANILNIDYLQLLEDCKDNEKVYN